MNKSSPAHVSSNGNGKHIIKAPRNKVASEIYHKTFGQGLAELALQERKSALFGNISQFDRFSDVAQLPSREGYTQTKRPQVYRKAIDLYENSELVRPIINLIAAAIFSNSLSPGRLMDVTGSRSDLIEMARKILDFNSLNLHDLAREGELAGDVFLAFEPNADQTKIFSLDAGSTTSVLRDKNVRDVTGYEVARGADNPMRLKTDIVQHLRFNSTTTSQYGRSSLRPLMYWFDVEDTLFEKNWLRGAQYFGNPQLAITGVPGPYQANVKSQMEGQTQRAGRVLILPPDSDAKAVDYSLGFPIGDIVAWVFRLISIGSEVPVTLLGTADAGSRGSAFFANPRFTLAIRPKREVWRIGFRQLFMKIFKNIGVLNDKEVLTCEEFDFAFFPIFDKDLEDLAEVMDVYRTNKMVSIKTAQRMLGLDPEREEENMEDEPDDVALPTVAGPPQGTAPPKREARKAKRKARRSVEN